MAKLRASNIEPQSGTNLTLGASGDTVTISSTDVRSNTVKDAGGNTLWVSNGSGTLSSVNSALAGGGVTLLNTTTVNSVSEVVFGSSIINSTYDEYWIFWDGLHNSNEGEFLLSFSHNGGSTPTTKTSTTWNAQQPISGGTGDFSYQTTTDCNGQTSGAKLSVNIQMNADNGLAGCMKVYQPSSSTYNTWMSFDSSYETTGAQIDHLYGAVYNQDAAENATNYISFYVQGGTMVTGTFKVYGVG